MLARRFWIDQPPVGAQLRNSIFGRTIGTSLVAPMGALATDGAQVVTIGTAPPTTALGKIAYAGDSGGTNMVRAQMRKSLVLGTDSEITLVVVFRVRTQETGKNIATLGSDSGSAGNTIFSFSTGGADAAKVRFICSTSAGVNRFDVTSLNSWTTPCDGKWHCAVMSAQLGASGLVRVTIDGALEGAATGATGSPAATTFQWVCALGNRRTTDIGGNLTGDVALVVPIFGFISTFERVSLSKNPWQLFYTRPPVPLFGVTAVAGSFNAAWNVAANSVHHPGALAA